MKIEDYFKYYIQGSDHYLIPKDVFKELFDEMSNWRKESKELKLELSGYRQAILEDKEMLGLKQENQKYKEVIDKAIEYLETKRIREKAIIDIDVLEGILKEVE